MNKKFFIAAGSCLCLLSGFVRSQNIAVNSTGNAAAGTNMFEVTQSSTAAYMVALYAIHNANNLATDSGYAFKAIKTGTTGHNVAGYFSASGGGSNSAIIVPKNMGFVGIGTTSPQRLLHLENGNAQIMTYDTDAGISWTRPAWVFGSFAGAFHIQSTHDRTAASALNRFYVNPEGVVGIGTTAPVALLHINPTYTVSTDTRSLQSGMNYNGAGTMTNWYGHYIAAPTGSGAITNRYAFVTEDAAGSAGIGTLTPKANDGFAKLTVQGTARTHVDIESPSTSAGAIGDFRIRATGGSVGGYNNWDMSFRSDAWGGGAGSLTFYGDHSTAGSVHGMSLLPNGTSNPFLYVPGNVGIGTPSPFGQLHINIAGQPSFLMSDTRTAGNQVGRVVYDGGTTVTGGGWVFQKMTDAGVFSTNLVSIIQNTGNVGIGTITPGAKLDVQSGGVGINIRTNYLDLHGDNAATSDRPYFRGTTSHLVINGGGTTAGGDLYLNYTGDGVTGNVRIRENLFVMNTGNVGIGTTGPTTKLDVTSNASGGIRVIGPASGVTNGMLQVRDNDDGAVVAWPGGGHITIWPNTNGLGIFRFVKSSISAWNFIDRSTANTAAGRILAINDANGVGDIMTFLGGGYVGIGTTTPARALEVLGSGAGSHTAVFKNTTSYGVAIGACNAQTYGSIQGISVALGTNTNLVMQESGGNVGIGINAPINKLQVVGLSRFSANAGYSAGDAVAIGNDVYLSDYDVANSVSINGQQNSTLGSIRLGSGGGTISGSGGNIGIGTTAPGYALQVVGAVYASGVVYCNGFAMCSDLRYKKQITPLSNALSNVLKLQGVNYFWKTKDFPDKNFTDEVQLGFIAQEVEKIYPQMITTDNDGYKSVDYARLTPVLVEAIKEQQKMIESQRTEIGSQRKEIESLNSKFTGLESIVKTLQLQIGTEAKK